MRIDESKDCIYFIRVGWFRDSTMGYLLIPQNELVIVKDKDYSQIIGYLRKHMTVKETTFTLRIYAEKE